MSSLLKLRRGSTVSHAGFTGADGEVTFDTDKNCLVTHDGATAGGFPHVKAGDLSASGGAALVGNDGETVASALTRSGKANEHAFGNVKQNISDYATLGANLLPAFASLTKVNFDVNGNHTAGTVGTLTGNVVGDPFGYYLLKVVITTTSAGHIAFRKSGVTVFGDLPEYYFSNATVLLDGLENNRVLTTNDYYFYLSNSAAGFANISLETDLNWAGQVSTVEMYAVTSTKFAFAGAGSELLATKNPLGLKVTGLHRNDLVLGNKEALGAYQYDGQSPTPSSNVAIGSYALASNQHGDENTAVGSYALTYNEGSDNTGIGYSALKFNTKGQENTAVGYKSGAFNTTGFRNTFVGFWSGSYNKSGSYNTRIGWAPNISTGISSGDTSVGAAAGTAVLTGGENCFFGSGSGVTVTGQSELNLSGAAGFGYNSKPWGQYTVAIGHSAKVGTEIAFANYGIAIGNNANVTNDGAVAIGASASCTSTLTTAIGSSSLASGDSCVAVGYNTRATVGIRNTAVGRDAIASATAGEGTAIGYAATASAQYTTAIGSQSGKKVTGAQNTFVGVSAGNITVSTFSNVSCLGFATDVTGSNQVQLGNSSTATYAYGAVQNRSDVRDKADIRDTVLGLDFINSLRPVDFKWDYREDYGWGAKDGSKKRSRYHHGLIAQEVKAVIETTGADFGGFQDHGISGGADVLSIGYEELIAPMIKAIQELKAEFDAYKASHP